MRVISAWNPGLKNPPFIRSWSSMEVEDGEIAVGCPFCGRSPDGMGVGSAKGGYFSQRRCWVYCKSCFAVGPYDVTLRGAIDRWERRP